MRRYYYILSIIASLCILGQQFSHAQDLTCTEKSGDFQGEVFMNYGSIANAVNSDNRTAFSIGQTVVGQTSGQNNQGRFGFWSRFLLPPLSPHVTASRGDYPDRIQLSWIKDPLSPVTTDGFKIFRDGAFLVSLDDGVFEFIDFNVQAGEYYEYVVIGYNDFGQGYRGRAVGFVNPNGVVSGRVTTQNGNPVRDVSVTLTPTISKSLLFDGVDDYLCIPYRESLFTNEFTVSAWVKIGASYDSDGILDYGSDQGDNWWIHTTASGQSKGVIVGIGNSGSAQTLEYEFQSTPDGWHHIAATYNGSNLILYADGEFVNSRAATMSKDSATIAMGRRKDGTHYLDGRIDDVRISSRPHSQTEIQQTMLTTVSSTTPGLVAYWKLDEGKGDKAFDISLNRIHARIFGATYAADNPGVLNAGLTDEAGFYNIEGIDYSSNGSFTATPKKSFYFNQALEFNAANQSYANLTDFDLPDASTIELSFNAFDTQSEQVLFSKKNGSGDIFEVYLNGAAIFLRVNGTVHNVGTITKGYRRLAITLDHQTSQLDAGVYLDGVDLGVFTFSGLEKDWLGEEWILAKSAEVGNERYYTGLIDEIVFYKNISSIGDIQVHANTGVEVADTNLLSYFNLNEGQNSDLTNLGPAMTGTGNLINAGWSTNVANPEVVPHEFTPNSRRANINTSNTAIGNIDFTDISTVAISGIVRYENTFCFAQGIEILVNGKSHFPPIFTDVDGRFVADFEPGTNIRLTPKFGDHNFLPGFFEVRNISSPVAGVLFQDLTKRTIVGQVAGGDCRLSIIDVANNAKVKVKISSSENGCYERILEFSNADGKYTFTGVPPIPLTVAVIEHSDPIIHSAFQNQGGQSIDMREVEKDTVDFIYYAHPQVELTPFTVNSCNVPLMQQPREYELKMKVFQQYTGGKCYLPTADIRIVNDIEDKASFDTVMLGGQLIYRFKAGNPNILSPYTKKVEVTATTTDGSIANASQEAIVLGKKANLTTFASASPQMPLFILRDPPGDGSFSYMEKGETTCNTVVLDVTDARDTSVHLTVSLGPDLEIETGFFIAKSTVIDATADFGVETSMSYTTGKSNEIENCLTMTETWSTSDGDMIVGDQGGDLFVGVAYNFLYGSSQDLLYNSDSCEVYIETNLTVLPKNFKTKFAYTEYHIRNVEIPRLIANDSLNAANQWQKILQNNEDQKKNAIFKENFSFSAGAVYEKSITTERTESTTFSYTVDSSHQIAVDLGLTFDGIGFVGGFVQNLTTSRSKDSTNTSQKTTTVGYVLTDDDIGDNFTIDIKEDKKDGTPVFKLVSGKTMCPYETNTLNREEVSLSIDKNNAININSNDKAVFKLTVGNLSDEFKVYTLTPVPESNPDGAIVKISGSTAAMDLEVDAGGTVELTMTVERGPVAYTYEDLAVAVFSACEDDRADFLGIDIDPKFYQEISYNVQYIEPCSEVDINFPQQNWVVTPAQDTQLTITVSEYELDDEDLELIRVQYRKIGGDGAWINIIDLAKEDLGPIFKNVVWKMNLLDDGPYEIRALTQCTTGTLAPGISTVIQGRLETKPPKIFGTPQPADGILSANDEISVTFNEYIDCSQIFQADQNGNNNIGLYDATSGALIDAIISCNNGKLVIVPNIQNKFIENRTLRVELDQIPDLSGNVTGHLQWEFLVDRNPLAWIGPDISELMTVNEPITVMRQIQNRGGTIVSFSIKNIPSWVTVSPNNININPGQIVEISFAFQQDLLIGDYHQEVSLEGTEGVEPLDITLKVRCPAPNWNFTNQAGFENTMNFALELDILGTKSTDVADIVVAFINDEIRGVSNVKYVASLNKYIAFLTVYHDGSGDTIKINVFDSDKCIIYAEILEVFKYIPGGLVGSPLVPKVIHVQNIVERTIPLAKGWNWISFNVDYGNNAIAKVLGSLHRPEGSTIKTSNEFSTRFNNMWLGSVQNIGYQQRYMYKAANADTLVLRGTPYSLAVSPTTINTGWNWLGFTPQQGMSLESALQSLNPLNGDIIKSQTEFAQYVAGVGWIGNLNFLQPGRGYLLNISNAGTLLFPEIEESLGGPEPLAHELKSSEKNKAYWKTDFNRFEENMNIIAIIRDQEKLLITEGDEIGVFINDELRGNAQAVYVESLQSYRFFITLYGDIDGSKVSFKYLNHNRNSIFKILETEQFSKNNLVGTVQEPVILTIGKMESDDLRTNDVVLKSSVSDILNNIPDQTINLGESFGSIDLGLFLDEGTSCSNYKAKYLISSGNVLAAPTCTKGTYPNSMTAFVKFSYGDSLAFNDAGDRVTLFDPLNRVVECAQSFNDALKPSEKIYFLNVGGEDDNYPVRLRYYSAFYKRTFELDSIFQYVSNASIGKPDSSLIIDLSPLRSQLTGAQMNVAVNDIDWTGTQVFIVHANNCTNGMSGIDTVNYTVLSSGALCTNPIIFKIGVVQPNSNSCDMSNSDGEILITAALADSFSIDAGVTFQTSPHFIGLKNANYQIVAKNIGGCFDTGAAQLLNSAFMAATVRDSSVNCTDRTAIKLTATINAGVGPFVYVWKNQSDITIPIDSMVEDGTYFVTITDAQNCSFQSQLNIARDVNPLDWILPGIISGDQRVCESEQNVLYTTGLNVNHGQISWTYTGVGVAITSLEGGKNASLDFGDGATSGWLRVQISNQCRTVMDSIAISINDLSVSLSDLQTNCTDNPTVLLTANGVNGNTPYNYSWQNDAGQAVNPLVGVSEGQFAVQVTDGDLCTVEGTLTVFKAADPLTNIAGKFLNGPEVVCPGVVNVLYDLKPMSGMNNISWYYGGGANVNITEMDGGMMASVEYGAGAVSDYLKVNLSNYCSVKTDSLLIKYANPFWCANYSNCTPTVHITSGLLQSANTPQVYHAGSTMTLNANVPQKNYEFKAGQTIEFQHGFEVPLGAEIKARILPCNQN